MRLRFVLAFALAAAAVVPAALPVREAAASVSIAATFDGLLQGSSAAVLVVPSEQTSLWENGRIYTYTRARVERAAAGEVAPGTDVWIRTMGGIVGKLGQHVDGEAVFVVGRPALVFLHAAQPGSYEVTARAQGQYPVVTDDKKAVRIMRSGAVGVLLPPKTIARPGPLAPQSQTAPAPVLAADVLHGRTLDEASREIASAWKRAHAPK